MKKENSEGLLNPIICKYLAQKIVQDLREGVSIDPDLFDFIKGYPVIDHVRRALTGNDLDTVKTLCTSDQRNYRNLGFSLLAPFANESDVKNLLYRLWKENEDNYSSKRLLIWRLLDISDLPDQYHEQIFRFLKRHSAEFLNDHLAWVQGDTMTYVRERLEDSSFPKAKAWIYLFIGSLVEKEDRLKNLLNTYANSESAFVARVAQELLGEA